MEVPNIVVEQIRQYTFINSIVAGFAITMAIQLVSMKDRSFFVSFSVLLLSSCSIIAIFNTLMSNQTALVLSQELNINGYNTTIISNKINGVVQNLNTMTGISFSLFGAGVAAAGKIQSQKILFGLFIVIVIMAFVSYSIMIDVRWLNIFAK